VKYRFFPHNSHFAGSRPQESKGSISRAVIQDNHDLDPAHWGMKISKVSGKTVRLTIMPSAKAIIGDYEVYVETKMAPSENDTSGKKLICKYKDNEKLCILFNAWCKGKKETWNAVNKIISKPLRSALVIKNGSLKMDWINIVLNLETFKDETSKWCASMEGANVCYVLKVKPQCSHRLSIS